MTENQWISLVAMLGVLALVAWRMPRRRVLIGVIIGLAAALIFGIVLER